MEIQLVLLIILMLGIMISGWMLTSTSRRIHSERNIIIQNKVISMGGNILKIEQVKRTDCPINEDYREIDSSYKFFRINYTLDDKLKEGWAILSMKQNWYGPNGAIDAKWMWRF